MLSWIRNIFSSLKGEVFILALVVQGIIGVSTWLKTRKGVKKDVQEKHLKKQSEVHQAVIDNLDDERSTADRMRDGDF